MRALVIEDYPPLRTAIVAALKSADFSVDSCADGTEGDWLASSEVYDIILLDLGLPQIDGLDVLRRLRERGSQAHVLVVTARDQVADRCAGLDAGADDYLVKPFAIPEMLARVRALLRRAYQRKDPILRVADLVINTSQRTAARGRRDIPLTSREYALLTFLALRTGEVVPREDIRTHLYDFRSDNDSNVIDVYIGYLRRKLEAEGSAKILHTRRGHGWFLGLQP